MLSEYETKIIQADLLLLLDKFHMICEKHQIKYSLHGGTLLGAIRDKGFIPWDDDADLSITREEYNKLVKILKNDSENNGLKFDDKTNRFPRIWMCNRENLWVCADIFIYDYISENKFLQKVKITGLAFFLAFLKNKETLYLGKVRGRYNGFMFGIIYLIYFFGKLFPKEKKYKWAESFAQILGGNHSFIHRSNDVYAGIIHILPYYVMTKYELTQFENRMYMVSSYAHEILENNYGSNYMIPLKDDSGGGSAATHAMVREMASRFFSHKEK